MCATALFLTLAFLAQDEPATFGTTVVIPSGLKGELYDIRHNSAHLPKFEKRKSVGAIYTSSLDIKPQAFDRGFPGVTKRVEWFAIDYTGRFWIEHPGKYKFALTSDDGSKLYIDDAEVIDNDGTHPPLTKSATVDLAGGIHTLRVSYFQGPKWEVALVLEVAEEAKPLRVFSTDEFKPPPNPETWVYPAKHLQ